jgi:hypothetical protein
LGQIVASSSATVSSPQSGAVAIHESREGSESFLGGLLDPRLSLIHAPSDQLNWSVHLGLSTMGAELRALPLGSGGKAPIVVAIGGQMDGMYLLASDEEHRGPLSGELRVTGSIHPVISNRLKVIAGAGDTSAAVAATSSSPTMWSASARAISSSRPRRWSRVRKRAPKRWSGCPPP